MNKPLKLDQDELEILKDFERGELESIKNFRDEKRKLEEAARNTLQKNKRINIRLSSRDLETIQKKAAKERQPAIPAALYEAEHGWPERRPKQHGFDSHEGGNRAGKVGVCFPYERSPNVRFRVQYSHRPICYHRAHTLPPAMQLPHLRRKHLPDPVTIP